MIDLKLIDEAVEDCIHDIDIDYSLIILDDEFLKLTLYKWDHSISHVWPINGLKQLRDPLAVVSRSTKLLIDELIDEVAWDDKLPSG